MFITPQNKQGGIHGKTIFVGAGPTAIPPEVLLKMAEPIIHHQNRLFEAVVEEVRENLKYVFGTKNEVLVFASSVPVQ